MVRVKLVEKLDAIINWLAEEQHTEQTTTPMIRRAIMSAVTLNVTNVRNYFDLLIANHYITEIAASIWRIDKPAKI